MLKDTIISAFNYDGTLLKWLKKVEEALQNASASEFRVNKKGNATISFSIVFANGDTLESGDIILQQGESVTGATIRQGHLILTLSNGDELDAGDIGAVTGFSINDSQHLIVTYQNGTTQDLGAIFNGTTIKVNTLTSDSPEISTLKPIIEDMTGYSFNTITTENISETINYAGVCKNGNKITFVIASTVTRTGNVEGNSFTLGRFLVPSSIASKLYPQISTNVLGAYNVYLQATYNTGISRPTRFIKYPDSNYMIVNIYEVQELELNTPYYVRFEATFLLSENLA